MNYLMLVNKSNVLSSSYIPIDLVIVENKKGDNPNLILKLDRVVAEMFKKLQNEALKDGYNIICDSAYRDFYFQMYLIDKKKKQKKDLSQIAKPGSSEHQTGLCIDIAGIVNGKYTDKDADLKEIYAWLEKNAYKYGFIIRYPKGKEYITGYPYEPWHIRYVGRKVAEIIDLNKITLEEYLEKTVRNIKIY